MDVSTGDSKALDTRLQGNLEALRVCQPGLAERVRNLPASEQLDLIPTDTGRWTARARCEDGCEVLLASRRDPETEASRWVDSLDDINEDIHTVVIHGCGLGYHVAELLNRRRGGLVVVMEPSLATVHAALRCQDFITDLLVRRLVFVVAGRRADLFSPLERHSVELMLDTRLKHHPVCSRVTPTQTQKIMSEYTEYLHFVRSALVTTLEISAASIDNVLQNLTSYFTWPGVDELKDSWKGKPALCVAAGPSLRKNMHLLKRAKGKAAVIAVQTVLRPLLAAGIEPDFVTALDFSPLSRPFYENLPDVSGVTLVADPKVHPIAPDSYPGPKRIFGQGYIGQLLPDEAGRRDLLRAGSTVAHLNLYLAEYLGADPIVLVGQDLGYGENIYYAPGNPIHSTWWPEFNRFHTMEMMEWMRIVRYRQSLRKVPSQHGWDMYTDGQMFTYIQQFERDIARSKSRVLNASEGGAKIHGAEEVTLESVLDEHCGPEVQPQPLPIAQADPAAGEQMARAVEQLRERLDELDRMDEICSKVLPPLREMQNSLDNPRKFNRFHAKMNKWRVKIDEISRIYQLVAEVSQVAELTRMRHDQARHRKDLDEIGERREQLSRDIQYVSLLQRGIGTLRTSVEKAIDRLEAQAS